MSNYTREDVDSLIKTLRTDLHANKPAKKMPRRFYGKDKKPFLNRIQKTINYLEQRHMFFNPNKEMLSYIIGIVKKSGQEQELLSKMKEDLLTKQ